MWHYSWDISQNRIRYEGGCGQKIQRSTSPEKQLGLSEKVIRVREERSEEEQLCEDLFEDEVLDTALRGNNMNLCIYQYSL